jgi:hypothetical protein
MKQFQQRIIRVDCVSLLSRISHAFQEVNNGSLEKGWDSSPAQATVENARNQM